MSLNYNWMYRRARAPRATRASHAQQTPVKRHEQTQKRMCVCMYLGLAGGRRGGGRRGRGRRGRRGRRTIILNFCGRRHVEGTRGKHGVHVEGTRGKEGDGMRAEWHACLHRNSMHGKTTFQLIGWCCRNVSTGQRASVHWEWSLLCAPLRLHRLQQYVLG